MSRAVFELGVAVLLKPLGGLTGALGKPPAGQSAVRGHGNVLLPAVGCHLPFLFPEDQVVVPLNGDKFGKALFLRQGVGLGELPGKAV